MNLKKKNHSYRIFLIIILFYNLQASISIATDNSWDLSDRGPLGGNIQAIAIDPNDQNKVYVGTLGGGFYWTDNFKINQPSWHQKNDNLPCWNILSLMIKGNKIYAGTTCGLFCLDLTKIRSANWLPYLEDQLGAYTIFRLRNCEDSQYPEAFYAMGYEAQRNDYQRKLIIIEPGTETPKFAGSPLANYNVFDVAPYRDINHINHDILGKLFVATDNGLYRFNDSLSSFTQRFAHTTINCLAVRWFLRSDSHKVEPIVFVGTPHGGKFAINDIDWWRDFLTDSSITHLEPWFSNKVIPNEEKIVRIYANTQGGHIFYKDEITYDVQIWPEYSRKGLSSPSINSFAVDKNNVQFLLAGSRDGIYSSINNDSWKSKNSKNLFAHRIHAIIEHNNRLWCGSDGMLFDRQIGIDPNWNEKKIFKYITTIASYPGANKIYFGTKGEGVWTYYYESGSAVPFSTGQLPDTSSISALEIEQKINPNMYVGTEEGKVYWFESSKWNELAVLDPAPITSIAIDSVDLPKGNILYISQDQKVYQIDLNVKYSTPPSGWSTNSNVNSVVFNNKTNQLFAGTSKGIMSHSVNDEIQKNWLKYNSLALSDSNVQELHIIPTDPAFHGVLYAMTSDSVKRFSRIWRNIIGTNIKDHTVGYPGPECQFGESFCVNLNNPNIVYMGTAGSGVYKYEFDQGSTPTIVVNPQNFGDVPRGSKASGSITITNNNSFSPLLVNFEIDDDSNFTIETSKTLIVYPGTNAKESFAFTFNPKKYEMIKSNLHVYFRDIFLTPVQKDSIVIEVYGTGKGADFIIKDTADSIIYCYYKAYPESPIIDTFKWKKVGTDRINNFTVVGPSKDSPFYPLENWANDFNSKDSGYVHLSFKPTQLDTIKDFIQIRYFKNNTDPETKIIKLEGICLDAIVELDTNVINFGEVPEQDHSLPKPVYLMNSGNISLFIENARLANNNNVFQIESCKTFPFKIELRDTAEILNLTFNPNKIDDFQDSLIITHCDSGLVDIDTTTILLVGKGDTNMVAPFPIDALDFDTVHVKKLRKNSERKSFYIKNISTKYNVWLDSIYLSNYTAFQIIINPAPKALNFYDSVQVCLEFFADPEKEDTSLLGEHTYLFNIKYRFGTNEANASAAIRTDTLKGFMISSFRIGNPTIWETTVPIRGSDTTTFTYYNSGNIPLYRQFLNVPADTTFKHEFSCKKIDTISAGESLLDKLIFSPIDTVTKEDKIRIHFWDIDFEGDICISDIVNISLIGKGIDNISPKIESVEYSSPVWYRSDTVVAKVYDEHSGLKKNSPTLFYRIGGYSHFSYKQMNDTGNFDSTYFAIIPGDLITSKGIEFFIEAVDNSNTEGYYPPIESEFRYLSPPVKINDSGITKTKDCLDNGEIEFLQGGHAQQYYQFISIPLDSLTRSAKDILNESFDLKDFHGHRWRCIDYQFDAAIGKTRRIEIDTYTFDKPFSDFVPGKSFLLLIDYRYPKRSIQRQTGITVTTAQKFKYPIHNGWNFIGNPFNFPIPKGHISLAKQEKFTLYAYEDGWTEYDSLDADKRFLYPWGGAAIYSKKEDTLLICPNLNPSYGPTELSRPIEKPEYKWFISIGAFCQQSKDVNNIAAVSKASTLGLDNFDAPEPPAIGEFVKLCFPHPEWNQIYDEYAKDVRSSTEQAYCWDFDVITNISNSEISLIFNNVASVPNDFQIFVICEELNIRQNLRKNDKIVFKATNIFVEHHFKLVIGKENFINSYAIGSDLLPKDYKLHASYPNPFWMSAEIKYEIPQQERITIAIYNLLGELIKTIDHGTRLAGKYSVFWDGTDDKNLPVRNGVYFCKFTTPNFSKTIKMTLLR